MLASIILLAQLTGAAPCAKAAYAPWAIDEWSRNIATLSSPKGGEGYGVVVGWRPGEVWVAAPAHVVFGQGEFPDDASAYRAGLDVRLPGDRKERELCDVTGSRTNPRPPQDPEIDLAFVCVEWLGLPLFSSSLPARSIRAGDALQLIRSDAGQDYVGAVASQSAHEIGTTFTGIGGMSGAPVVTPAGVAGLYLGAKGGARDGRVLPMETIRHFAQQSHVPWELVTNEFFDCNRTRRVCVSVERGVTPASTTLESLFRDGKATVTPGACVDIPEGKYAIAPGSATTCEPQTISVFSADDSLSVKLTCAPNLGGTWRTPDGDWFMCMDKNPGEATCGGLNKLGLGILQATLSAKGNQVSLLGAFIAANGKSRSATGSFTWSTGHMSGEIRREQYPPKAVELKREETP